MRIIVSYRGEKKELELQKSKVRVAELLKSLGLSEQYAFVVKGDQILQGGDYLEDGEEVRVINAISGG